jgi:hypothetical protein
MLCELIHLWPSVLGQGWEKAQIHKHLHVPVDAILWNGEPQGSHMGHTEHNHIRLVKDPAQSTQQCVVLLNRELGQRVGDVGVVYQCMAYPE